MDILRNLLPGSYDVFDVQRDRLFYIGQSFLMGESPRMTAGQRWTTRMKRPGAVLELVFLDNNAKSV
jgi:hypothetical protein